MPLGRNQQQLQAALQAAIKRARDRRVSTCPWRREQDFSESQKEFGKDAANFRKYKAPKAKFHVHY